MNKKKSSESMASLASKVLNNDSASKIQKTLAGSVLSQTNSNKQTGAELEGIASNALKSPKYNDVTKKLAGSVLSRQIKNASTF